MFGHQFAWKIRKEMMSVSNRFANVYWPDIPILDPDTTLEPNLQVFGGKILTSIVLQYAAYCSRYIHYISSLIQSSLLSLVVLGATIGYLLVCIFIISLDNLSIFKSFSKLLIGDLSIARSLFLAIRYRILLRIYPQTDRFF